MDLRDLVVDANGWPVGPFPASGRAIRYLVVAELIRSGAAMPVASLVDRLRSQDILLPLRASKAVSDSLRWEVRKGRVVKAGWGVYRLGPVPRSTRYWLLTKAEGFRALHVASPAPDNH